MKKVGILILCLFLCGCSKEDKSEEYVKFQDKHSMDWDSEESNLLMLLAENKGGSVEDRCYNILVALNRVWSPEYPNTIEEVVDLELPCGKMKLTISEETQEAMDMILYDGVDNSKGSLEYTDE
jgi:hypothetical protein